MGGRDAGKGFEYQDLCALFRVSELFEIGSDQFLQVEDLHRASGDVTEPWDFRIVNPDPPEGLQFKEELWQAKDTRVSKGQCCVYWKNMHSKAHNGSLECSAQSELKKDVALGIITSAPAVRDVDRFRQFSELLRDYHKHPDQEDLKDIITNDFIGVDLDAFVDQLTGGKAGSLSYFDFNAESNGSVFWFQRFLLEEYKERELRARILLNCGRRLGIHVPDEETAFEQICGPALSLIRRKYGHPILFDDLVSTFEGRKASSSPSRVVISEILSSQKQWVESKLNDEVALRKLFVESLGKTLKAKHLEEDDKSSSARPWLETHLNRGSNFVLVLGDFGHGKTTLLKIVAAGLAETWSAGKPIPVFIPLRRFFEETHSLYDLVAESLAGRVEVTQSIWRANHWQIFCDGFDELNALHQDRPDWVRGKFNKLYQAGCRDNISIVLSSRPILFLDLHERGKYLSSFDRVLLNPFTPQQISQWLSNNRDELTLEALQDRKIDEIAATPVILSLVSQLHRAGKLRARKYRRSEVYKEFFDWVASTGGALEEAEIQQKHQQVSREALQKIAVHLFSHPESQSGLIWVPLLLNELEYDGFHFDERLFVRHAFHEGKPDYIEFLHQSLREYLVAELCFDSIFQFDEDDELFPDFQSVLFEEPLTIAKVDFFRDLVAAAAEQHGEKYSDTFSRIPEWPQILWNLQFQFTGDDAKQWARQILSGDERVEEKALRLTWFPFSRRIKNGVGRDMLSSSLQVPLGNLSLLMFLASAHYQRTLSERNPDLFTGLIGVKRFLGSYSELSMLAMILRTSLSGLAFEGTSWPVQHECFDAFRFRKNSFHNLRFESCFFDKTTFEHCEIGGETVFSDCRFQECQFSECTFSTVFFERCFIDAGPLLSGGTLSGAETVSFKECIFGLPEEAFEEAGFQLINCRFLPLGK